MQSVNQQLEQYGDPEIMMVTLSVLEGLWVEEYWKQRLQMSDDKNTENYVKIWPSDDDKTTLSDAALEMLHHNSITMHVS
jgi:hypothetical protein